MPLTRFTDTVLDADPEEAAVVEQFEYNLRPTNFAQVIGREREKKTLSLMIRASQTTGEALDHVLFHGPPGLGKTSLAHVVAQELGVPIQVTSGPALAKQGDLAAILSSISARSILFIDEIHRLPKASEEILYPAMEDRALDVVVGSGAGAKIVRLDLEPFTVVAATTRVGLISKPLRDRFGADFRLDYYSAAEMAELVAQKAKLLQLDLHAEAAANIAQRSRQTPRIALKVLKRVRDHALATDVKLVTSELVDATLDLLEIDTLGLDALDRKILLALVQKFAGGPVGIQTLAAAVSEEVDTIGDVYEPYLLQTGFLERTPRGRKATALAYRHLGLYNETDDNSAEQ